MFFLFLMLICSISYCYEVEDGLISVAVVYRHGDRTPIKGYANDPYRNASFWPVGFGQLTNVGKMQHFGLGQWLRSRYKDFIPEQYSEKDFYILSTDVDRTLMSVASNFAGMLPPKGKQIWNNNLLWQPVPIHTNLEAQDYILGMKHPCDRYTYLIQKLLNSNEFTKIQEQNRQLYNYLTTHSGENINSLESLLSLYDTLMIEKWYNFSLPDWTKKVFPDKMDPWAKLSFAIECYTPQLARLKIGPLFNNIINHFVGSTIGKGYKFITYSAHDTTIANILNSLQLFDYHLPPYCAMVLIELRFLNGKYFVNMLYKNSTNPIELVLKNCEFYCPLDKFTGILKPLLITPTQWKKECELKWLGFIPWYLYDSIFFISIVFLLLLNGIILFCVVYWKNKAASHNYTRLPSRENIKHFQD